MKNVYQCIAACAAKIAVSGISKDKKNEQQGYKFRGIDDVYNALAPIISEEGLVILPRVTNREVIERQTKSGGALFYTTVSVEFDFVSSHDGSKHTVVTYGEAMDSGDKSTNKAMSAAYKYACMQAFCIPTEGDNDADATTHEVVVKEDKITNKVGPDEYKLLEESLKGAPEQADLKFAWDKVKAAWERLNTPQQEQLVKLLDKRKREIYEADVIPDNKHMAG